MNSQRLKSEAMHWLRYAKQFHVVCSEVSTIGNCDVLAIGPKSSIEVETKISKADLRRDFTTKAHKHSYYASATGWTPNYFYFLVPLDLGEYAIELVKEKNPKYGVIAYNPDKHGRTGEHLDFIHKARKLHDVAPSDKLIQAAIARMSSELTGLHHVNLTLTDLLASQKTTGILDCENDNAADEQATELAFCVDGVRFGELDAPEKDRWRAADVRLRDAHFWQHAVPVSALRKK